MNARTDEPRYTKPQGARPTIGFLAEHLSDEYNSGMWDGVQDAAREQGANLIYFAGGILHDPRGFSAQANVLYELVDKENLDGLLIWGALLAHYTTLEELKAFCERYHPLPIVNIGLALEGIPSLLADNYQGMHDVVTHLIEVHGHRHIAYICGPGDIAESRDRYRGYADALAEHGAPLDPALVITKSDLMDEFRQKESGLGEIGVRILLDKRKRQPQVDLEALVGHDDGTSRWVLKTLQARGFHVPTDVAVASFDDVRFAQHLWPPLTTARQPFYDLGWRGAEMLLALLRGEEVPERVVLPMKVVVRQSCGCIDHMVAAAAVPVDDHSGHIASQEKLQAMPARDREKVIAEMAREVGGSAEASRRAEWVLDNFVTALAEEESSDIFLRALGKTLRQVIATGSGSLTSLGQDVAAWQEALSVLRRHLLPYLDNDALSRAENLWQQTRVLIGEMARWADAYQVLLAEERAWMLQEVGAALITTFDTRELMSVLTEGLCRLDIPSAYLALYENSRPYTYPLPAPEWSRLMLAYDEARPGDAVRLERVVLGDEGQRFRSRQLMPKDLWPRERRYSFVLAPLHFREHQIGFALFEVGPRERMVYGELRGEISSALEGGLLLQKRIRAEDALKQQAQELARSNAELEQFAYIASHDLQEPLRMVTSYVQMLARRYKGQLDADADDFISFAVDGAERMQILIHDLLQYSRVTTHGKPFTPTDCTTTLHHALANLEIAVEESDAVITHDELPTVMADETQLTRLLQNLISNAIKFRKKETRPEIHVSAERTGDEWTFSVRNNGIGIAPEYFERIFMIFQRLHSREEYTGTGIGLAVCKRIVERHGGRIWVESKLGEESTFYFTILGGGKAP
jgi:signal transduction histidine kinase/DNA-binding LacI/PurR family transcriptional regulator